MKTLSLTSFFKGTVLIALILLEGCISLGPKYHRPEFPIPCHYQNSTDRQECDTIWECWWEQFEDPCLIELIETAVARNFDLKLTKQKVIEARANYQSVRSILFPTGAFVFNSARVNASADIPIDLPFNNYDSFLFGFNAIWEPDILGFTSGVVAGAKRGMESTLEKHRDATMILISEVGRAYFTLRAVQCQEKYLRETLDSVYELIQLSQLQFREQMIGDSEIAVLEKSYCETKKALLTLQESKSLLINGLSMSIGELPGYLDCKLCSGCCCLPDLCCTLPPTGLPSELLCRRPDIREAEKILMKTTYDVGGAIGLFFPRLDLLTNLSYISFVLQDLFLGNNRNALNNVAALWPIIQGGRLIGNYKAKRAQEAQAFYYYAKTILGAFHDVENQLDAFRKEQERYRAQICVREKTEKLVKNASLLKEAGLASKKTLLEQKIQLLETEIHTVQSKSEMAIRMIALYKALGGGWESFREREGVTTKNPTILPF